MQQPQRRIIVPSMPQQAMRAAALSQPMTDDPYIGKTFFSNSHAYTITDIIAMGGMGSVYKAKHNIDGYAHADVAIKFIGADMRLDPTSKKRFAREARAMENIDHANVVKILDFGESEGHSFLVAEYIKGPSLRWILNRYGDLPPEYAAAILLHVCMGLGAVHEQGIIYRDMKPENIICLDRKLNITYESPMLKIIDFGAAKMDNTTSTMLTQTGNFIGTIHYMAPEQFEKEYDYRVDIYSTGILAYELFTGVLPFTADSFPAVMKMHCEMAPTPPSVAAGERELPAGIEEVIMRALAKNPDERFQSMGELAQAISACWHNQEISIKGGNGWLKAGIVAASVAAAAAAGWFFWPQISDAYKRYAEPIYNEYVAPVLGGKPPQRMELPAQIVPSQRPHAHKARPQRADEDAATDSLIEADTSTYVDTTYDAPSE